MQDELRTVGINSKGYGNYPKLVAQDKRLTIEAKAIYAYFVSYAGAGNTAFPGIAKIVYDLCISRGRYYRHFNLLAKYGYIIATQIKLDNKFSRNIYTLNMDISPCTHFEDTGNEDTQFEDTQNRDTNNNSSKNNSFKNNNVYRQKPKKDKYEDFYL